MLAREDYDEYPQDDRKQGEPAFKVINLGKIGGGQIDSSTKKPMKFSQKVNTAHQDKDFNVWIEKVANN